jgi:GAF domain-containing protein
VQKSVVVYEEGENQDLINKAMKDIGTNAMIGAPLLHNEEVIGVLSIATTKPKFNNIEKEALKIFTDQAAYVINMSELLKKSEQLTKSQESLIEDIKKISDKAANQDKQQVFEEIVTSVVNILKPPPMFCDLATIEEIENDQIIVFQANTPGETRAELSALNISLSKGSQSEDKKYRGRKGIVGLAIQKKKTILIQNVICMDDEQKREYIPFRDDVRSELAVPIIDAFTHEAIGVINIEHTQPEVFTKNHQYLVEAFADQVALTLKSQGLADAMKRRHTQFDNLIATNFILMTTTPESFKHTTRSQLEITCESIEATEAVLIPADVLVRLKRQGEIEQDITTDESEKVDIINEIITNKFYDEDKFFIRPNGLSIKVFEQRRPAYIADIHDEKRKDINPRLRDRNDIQSAVCLPLDIASDVLGVIWFHYKSKQPKRFEEDEQILVAYAHRYGFAYDKYLANKRAKNLERELTDLTSTLDKDFMKDYTFARNQQKWQFLSSFGIGILGAVAITLSVVIQSPDKLGRTIAAIGGGLVMVISALIYRRADLANDRADVYHMEQLAFRRLSYLFKFVEYLQEPESRSRLQHDFLRTALGKWFSSKVDILVSGAEPEERSDRVKEVPEPPNEAL